MGYEKYFVDIMNELFDALIDFDYAYEDDNVFEYPIETKKDIDYDDLIPINDREYEDAIKKENEKKNNETKRKRRI